jgi:hypothetical protein
VAPPRLYRRHDPAAATKYQDLRQLAQTQARVLAGTPGTLKQRTQSGRQYWVREHIRVDGRKTDEYLGAIDAKALAQRAAELDLAKALAAGSASLRLFGYQRIERKPAAVLAAFYNHGLVQAGLVLVGSHAYGALLNELGIVAPGYATQDIDVARGEPLPGAERLAVDLLVPGPDAGALIQVKELGAHAQAVPLLDFLVHEPVAAVVLSPNQVIPVRVPSPERFVVHKLFSSQSRKADRSKIAKDLSQAAVLAAALEDDSPGTLRALSREMPSAGRTAMKRGAQAAARLMASHPQAQEVLLAIAGR